MAKTKYYAVARGRDRNSRGVYDSWALCSQQVTGVSGAKFKSFESQHEAERYIIDNSGAQEAALYDLPPEHFGGHNPQASGGSPGRTLDGHVSSPGRAFGGGGHAAKRERIDSNSLSTPPKRSHVAGDETINLDSPDSPVHSQQDHSSRSAVAGGSGSVPFPGFLSAGAVRRECMQQAAGNSPGPSPKTSEPGTQDMIVIDDDDDHVQPPSAGAETHQQMPDFIPLPAASAGAEAQPELDEKQAEVYAACMRMGKNVFLTGMGGTGKTFLLTVLETHALTHMYAWTHAHAHAWTQPQAHT